MFKRISIFFPWNVSYRLAMPTLDNSRTLLAINREIYSWLDGDAGRMERLLESFDGHPWIVEFGVGARPGEDALRFLEVLGS